MVYFPEPVFKLVCSFLRHTISDLAKKHKGYYSNLLITRGYKHYIENPNELLNNVCNGIDKLIPFHTYKKVISIDHTIPNILRFNFALINCTKTVLSRIDKIQLIIGLTVFETVYPEIFDFLYDMYNIQKYNTTTTTPTDTTPPLNLNLNIPFYCSKVGIPSCVHNTCDIIIYFKEIPAFPDEDSLKMNAIIAENHNVTVKYSTLEYITNGTTDNCMRALFNIFVRFDTTLLSNIFLACAFIVETTEPSFSVKLNNDLLIMTRTKQIGKFGLFRLSPTLHNYDSYINFGRIDSPRMVKKHNIYIINMNGMTFKDHMAYLYYI